MAVQILTVLTIIHKGLSQAAINVSTVNKYRTSTSVFDVLWHQVNTGNQCPSNCNTTKCNTAKCNTLQTATQLNVLWEN
jgi:hypothetical protein